MIKHLILERRDFFFAGSRRFSPSFFSLYFFFPCQTLRLFFITSHLVKLQNCTTRSAQPSISRLISIISSFSLLFAAHSFLSSAALHFAARYSSLHLTPSSVQIIARLHQDVIISSQGCFFGVDFHIVGCLFLQRHQLLQHIITSFRSLYLFPFRS